MISRNSFLTLRNLAIIFLALAVVKFAVRGPFRSILTPYDFAPVYAQARAWAAGIQPYDGHEVDKLLASTGSRLRHHDTLIYPISNSVLLAPVAVMPWSAACVVWRIFGVLLVMLQTAALVAAARLRWSETKGLFLVGLLIGLASTATGLSSGQSSIPSVACGVLSVCCLRAGHMTCAGILVGLAAAFKPQIGAPFFLYYVLNRNWRAMWIGLVTLAAVYAIGYLRLMIAGVSIAETWDLWMPRVTYVAGHAEEGNLFSQDARYNLINLHALLFCFVADGRAVSNIVLGLGFVTFMAMSAMIWTRAKPTGDLIASGAVCVLSLLGAYHYHYDALLLAIPIAGAVAALDERRRLWTWGIVATSLLFLVPGPSSMLVMKRLGWIPGDISSSLWWQLLVSHQVWALIAILGFLMVGLRRQEKTGTLTGPVHGILAGMTRA